MHDGAVVQVTLSRRNVQRILDLAAEGRMPAQMRQGDMSLDPPEPTIIVAMEEDDVHYVDERYLGPQRSGDAADLVAEMRAVLLEADALLEVGEDPCTERFTAVIDWLKGVTRCKGGAVDCKRDTDGDGDCPACAPCCGGGDCANC